MSDLNEVTKIDVLKEISSVFHPLGLFSSVLLKGKLLLQTLWSKQLDWDDVISSEGQKSGYLSKIVSEYDQEIRHSQIADNPMAPRGRAAQPSRDTRKTN